MPEPLNNLDPSENLSTLLSVDLPETAKDKLKEAKHVAVFSTYQGDATVFPHVKRLIQALQDLDWFVVVVDTAPIKRSQLQDASVAYLHRDNIGYDFYSFKTGLLWLEAQGMLSQMESITICNDSVFGPLFDLKPLLTPLIEDGQVDFWGMSDSLEKTYHIQSYWVTFKKQTFDAVYSFFRAFQPIKDYDAIIQNGELKLTKTLLEAGFKAKALCESQQLERGKEPEGFTRERFLSAIFLGKLRFNASPWFHPMYRLGLAKRRNAVNRAVLNLFEQYYLKLNKRTKLNSRRLASMNPIVYFWHQCVQQFGYPFVKVRHLRENNPMLFNQEQVLATVRSKYPLIYQDIEAYHRQVPLAAFEAFIEVS